MSDQGKRLMSFLIQFLFRNSFKMADLTISEVRLKTLMKEIFKERIWEATEKPQSYQWEFWYHHDRNKESSEWYKWAKSKPRAYRDSAGRKSC